MFPNSAIPPRSPALASGATAPKGHAGHCVRRRSTVVKCSPDGTRYHRASGTGGEFAFECHPVGGRLRVRGAVEAREGEKGEKCPDEGEERSVPTCKTGEALPIAPVLLAAHGAAPPRPPGRTVRKVGRMMCGAGLFGRGGLKRQARGTALGSRLSALGSRLSALGSRLSALGSRLSALGSRLSALGSRLSALGSMRAAEDQAAFVKPFFKQSTTIGPSTPFRPGNRARRPVRAFSTSSPRPFRKRPMKPAYRASWMRRRTLTAETQSGTSNVPVSDPARLPDNLCEAAKGA